MMSLENYKNMRPKVLEGETAKVRTGCGNLYCTMNYGDSKDPKECLITMGKAGGCVSALMQSIAGLVTLGLKYSVPLEEIINKLKGISCYRKTDIADCCIDGIAQGLEWMEPKSQRG